MNLERTKKSRRGSEEEKRSRGHIHHESRKGTPGGGVDLRQIHRKQREDKQKQIIVKNATMKPIILYANLEVLKTVMGRWFRVEEHWLLPHRA